jgi:uncharacterized protein
MSGVASFPYWKVIAVRLALGKHSAMEPSEYRSRLREYIKAQAQPPDKFAHQPRLYHLAKTLAQDESYDDDVLYAAAWMHDLGVFLGHRPRDLQELARWDHVAYAVREAPTVLRSLGFPPEKIPAVLEAIRTHLPSEEPTSREGTFLRDADILEQLGTIGILRLISKVGRDTRYPTHGHAVEALKRAARDLPGKLRLAESRQRAIQRVALMEEFFAAVAAETDSGEL